MIDTTRKEGPTTPSGSRSDSDMIVDFNIPGVNDHIGSLRILEPIASGGMATVYKVRHEGLEVVRAIKILRPGCSGECRDRLLTEAKISANLHHPNIVQIYNVALWNGSIPYIEMEYIEGPSLRDLLSEKQRFPFIVAAAIGSVVCKALEFAAHQTFTVYGKQYQGLVHRDIKPANILLSAAGVIKLADFGIALPGSESLHTSGSVVMGTIPYLSPEQLNGERLDQRSDTYSLGTVLYEMISGEKAFKQKTMGEIVKVKLDNSYNPAHTLAPDVPQPFVDIIERSMDPDKDRRFSLAEDFGAALDDAIAKVSDQPPAEIIREYVRNKGTISIKTSPHLWKKGSNTRFLVSWLAGFAGVVLIMSGAIWIMDNPRPPRNREMSPTSVAQEPAMHAAAEPRPASGAAGVVKPQPGVKGADAAGPSRSDKPPPSPGSEGIAAFEAGNYQDAVSRLEEAIRSDLPPSVALVVRLRLLESYLRSGNMEAARLFAEKRIDDGYFHLLMGKMHLELDNGAAAQKALDLARRTPSAFGVILEEVDYHSALARDGQYLKKPNAENRVAALEAWSLFRDEYCRSPIAESRCREADKRVTELSR